MTELMEHDRHDTTAVAPPIPNPISNAYTDDCNEAEITFLQIAGRQKVDPTLVALPHLLTSEFQEETYVVLEKAGFFAEQAFQCLIPMDRHSDEQFSSQQ